MWTPVLSGPEFGSLDFGILEEYGGGEMATGITQAELERMLKAYREWKEREKIHVEGNIYRLPARRGQHITGIPDQWTVDVWDDEFWTTIISYVEDPLPELVADIFRARKAERR